MPPGRLVPPLPVNQTIVPAPVPPVVTWLRVRFAERMLALRVAMWLRPVPAVPLLVRSMLSKRIQSSVLLVRLTLVLVVPVRLLALDINVPEPLIPVRLPMAVPLTPPRLVMSGTGAPGRLVPPPSTAG